MSHKLRNGSVPLDLCYNSLSLELFFHVHFPKPTKHSWSSLVPPWPPKPEVNSPYSNLPENLPEFFQQILLSSYYNYLNMFFSHMRIQDPIRRIHECFILVSPCYLKQWVLNKQSTSIFQWLKLGILATVWPLPILPSWLYRFRDISITFGWITSVLLNRS